ncbi:hypothetical protein [Cetobacterium sp. SF1]|uniref:hypothetical protein n=1 Tax=Cetobacterium sp. SF1 TaxID=3417654 RepID=UPI003CEB3F2F
MIKKFLGYLVFILAFSQTILANNENTILLEGRKNPAKMKIAVTKLKTTELKLDYNIKEKLIYGELPNLSDEMVFVSESLETIPSLKTVGGKKIINILKKVKPGDEIKTKTLSYEVLDKDGKKYIKISPDTQVTGIFIYLVDRKDYQIKKIYKGIFKNTSRNLRAFCGDGHSRMTEVIFNPFRNGAIRLGKYQVMGPNDVIDPAGQRADYITTKGNIAGRIYPGDKYGHTWDNFDPIWNAVRIYVGTPEEAGKNYYTSDYYVKNQGTFESHISIPNINAKIRFYADNNSPNINFELNGWEGAINQIFTIEYRRDYYSDDISQLIHRDYFQLVMPGRTVTRTIDVNVESPIVQYNENTGFGLVESTTSSTKTLNSSGGTFPKNDPWIKVKNPVDYWGSDLGRHEVDIEYNGKVSHMKSMSNGGLPADFIANFVGAEMLVGNEGGSNKSTLFGVLSHNFEALRNKDIVVTHHYPPDRKQSVPAYVFTYRFNIEKFDGWKYYDESKANIKLSSPTIAHYTIGANGEVNFGSVVLKDLDIRITKQSGGDGIRIGTIEEVYLKSLDNPNYPLIPGKLFLQKGKNILEGKEQQEVSDNVIVTFDNLAEEKLIIGGKFQVLDKTGKSPLKIGTTVNGDTNKFYKSFGNLQIQVDKRYVETNILLNNPDFPIEGTKGWIKINSTQYGEGEVSGHPGIKWGTVTNPIDIPAGATMEIFTDKWKSLGNGPLFKLPIGNGYSVRLAHKKGDNYIAIGYEKGQFAINGAENTYFLRFTDKNGKILFTDKLHISFKEPVPLDHKTTVTFMNPLMVKGSTEGVGSIWFNGSDLAEGITYEYSNSEIIDYYTRKYVTWFKVDGGVDYNLTDEEVIKVYDRNGKYFGEISGNKSNQEIILKGNKGMFTLGYEPRLKALYTNLIGNSYSGQSIEDKFYLHVVDKTTGVQKQLNELTLNVEEFNPLVYIGFKNNESQRGKVGVGLERLKGGTVGNMKIKLNTNVTLLRRYLDVIKEMKVANDGVLTAGTLGEVNMYSGVEGDEVVKGTIMFNDLDRVSQKPDSLDKSYELYVQLTPSEYKKLRGDRNYKIYDNSGNKDVIKFGLTLGDKFLNTPYAKNIPFDKPLSFNTLPAFLEISATNLDFGKLNKHMGATIRKGETHVAVRGTEVNDFSLKIINGDVPLELYKENPDGSADETKFLKVDNLQLEKKSENSSKSLADKNQLDRIYKLSGNLHFDPNVEEGTYGNHVVVEATVIE